MQMVGIYARVSTDEQVGPELSITNQIQRLERYLQTHLGDANKPFLIRKRYQEEGRSGKDIESRPELQELLADIRQGTIDTLVA